MDARVIDIILASPMGKRFLIWTCGVTKITNKKNNRRIHGKKISAVLPNTTTPSFAPIITKVIIRIFMACIGVVGII
jgi:hypothetical protein